MISWVRAETPLPSACGRTRSGGMVRLRAAGRRNFCGRSHERVGFDLHPMPQSHGVLGWPPTIAGRPAVQPGGDAKRPRAFLMPQQCVGVIRAMVAYLVRMAKRPQVAIVVRSAAMERHDMIDFEAPVVWRLRAHAGAGHTQGCEPSAVAVPAVGLSFEAVGEGARRAARGRGEEHVAVEAARGHPVTSTHEMPRPIPMSRRLGLAIQPGCPTHTTRAAHVARRVPRGSHRGTCVR